MFDFSCWFCGASACNDWAHGLLQILLLFFAACAVIGLMLFVSWLVDCIENTAECNELSRENYRKCLDMNARLLALEKAHAVKRYDGKNAK